MFKGKRTYITAFLMVGAAAAKATGFEVPEEIFAVLAAFGFGFIRSAIEADK